METELKKAEPCGCDHGASLDGGQVLTMLAALPADALLDEAGLARALGCCPRTVRRLVCRFELPPGVPLAGRRRWLAGNVRDYIRARVEQAEKEARRAAARLGVIT